MSSETQTVIQVDRSKPFDPATFIGAEWTIEEQDERALTLTEIDLSKVILETTLREKKIISGREKFQRLKAMDCIRLDAGVFKTLLDNQHLIPLTWKERVNGCIKYVSFSGTVLGSVDSSGFTLCLYWYNKWLWNYSWLGYDISAADPSAVLPCGAITS